MTLTPTAPQSQMSPQPTPSPLRPRRHAFGWPAGSVRALLAFMVLGFLWLVALTFHGAADELPLIYIYLTYLMVLIIAHYFAARSGVFTPAPGERHPLGLPQGTVRVVLVLGFVGLLVWLFYSDRHFAYPKTASVTLPLVLLSAFFLGALTTRVARWLSRGPHAPPWFHDLQAWVALIALLGLAVLLLYHVFVEPTVQEHKATMEAVEKIGAPILAGILGFYFGARS